MCPHLQLHTSELEDGYDWGRLNLRSVTEESKLDEFLNTAKLAGTEFTAGKDKALFVKDQRWFINFIVCWSNYTSCYVEVIIAIFNL